MFVSNAKPVHLFIRFLGIVFIIFLSKDMLLSHIQSCFPILIKAVSFIPQYLI
jgi:hypothetical protein